jgi:predicted nucleotidyltransferase
VAPEDLQSFLDRFVEVCSNDSRVAAAFLGGSHARGEADAHSDVDLCMIASDHAFADLVANRADLVRRLGDPLFLEDFGLEDQIFFVLAEGTEGEIFFGSERRLGELEPGDYRSLYDPDGILDGVTFSEESVDPDYQEKVLREALTWFWHELSHFISAIGRDQLWWAAGQIEALRSHCVNLVRIEHRVWAGEEPYEKLDRTVGGVAVESLAPTFAPLERGALLEAAIRLVAFHRERGPAIAEANGTAYPFELAELLARRLDAVRERRSSD